MEDQKLHFYDSFFFLFVVFLELVNEGLLQGFIQAFPSLMLLSVRANFIDAYTRS